MGQDEIEILDYLKEFRTNFVSPVQICKRAGGIKRFKRDPEWARPLLLRMVRDGLLESDAHGHYRLTRLALEKYKPSKSEKRTARTCTAISQLVHKMDPIDDDKPFATLLREVVMSEFSKDEPED